MIQWKEFFQNLCYTEPCASESFCKTFQNIFLVFYLLIDSSVGCFLTPFFTRCLLSFRPSYWSLVNQYWQRTRYLWFIHRLILWSVACDVSVKPVGPSLLDAMNSTVSLCVWYHGNCSLEMCDFWWLKGITSFNGKLKKRYFP